MTEIRLEAVIPIYRDGVLSPFARRSNFIYDSARDDLSILRRCSGKSEVRVKRKSLVAIDVRSVSLWERSVSEAVPVRSPQEKFLLCEWMLTEFDIVSIRWRRIHLSASVVPSTAALRAIVGQYRLLVPLFTQFDICSLPFEHRVDLLSLFFQEAGIS